MCTFPCFNQVVAFLSSLLHPSKWPFMLVYMDDVPKGPTGKVGHVQESVRAERSDVPDGPTGQCE